MPRKAMSVCSVPGCPTLTYGGRCDACTVAARTRGRSRSKNYGAGWKKTRQAFLREHPYCECPDCLQLPAITRPAANTVDHIDGLGPLGPRGHDWSNLRAMTHACHSRHTARAQPGGWNDR